MHYSFRSEVAEIYGVEGAVIIENLYFWTLKNKANEKNFYDGHYWTYNSMKAFTVLFPFWTQRQIERILKNLEKKGAILTGNYNKLTYDRTKWYALSEKVKCIYVNGEMDLTDRVNDISPNGGMTFHHLVKPIPDNKPDNKPDNIYTTQFLEWYSLYPYKLNKEQTFKNFQKILKKETFENLMKATKNYIAYIKTNKIEKKYVVRSSNFIGQKQVYKGYLEMNLESTETGVESSLNTLENMDLEGENVSA